MEIESKLIEIYVFADDFCKEFEKVISEAQIAEDNGKRRRNKPSKLSYAEVITIMIAFHYGQFRNLKWFYVNYIQKHCRQYFPETVSYNSFVELQRCALLPLVLFLKTMHLGTCTGISFIDSTPIRVCNNKRINNHKVFSGIAQRGKSTMGYFYGFKLHLIINERGEVLSFLITPGNVDDRAPLRDANFIAKISHKLFADKGYISQELFDLLFIDGIQLITGMKRNMKGGLMSLNDKILLRKRSVIESVNDELKNMCQIEHSRHRSFHNFIGNIVSALIAYSYFPKKPSIKFDIDENDKQLTLF